AALQLVLRAGRLREPADAVHRRHEQPDRRHRRQVDATCHPGGRPTDVTPDRRRPRRPRRRRVDQRHRLAGGDAMNRAALLFLLILAAAAPALAADAPAGLSKLPKQTVFVDATYPPDAEAAGIEADVVLNLTIDATGHATHVEVSISAGPGRAAFDG